MKFKILERHMMIDDILRYLSATRKWRLPTQREADIFYRENKGISFISVITIDSIESMVLEDKRVNHYNLVAREEVNCSKLIKVKVLLVENEDYLHHVDIARKELNNGSLEPSLKESLKYILNL